MRMSTRVPSVAVTRLERIAGKRRRKRQAKLGEPRPLQKTRSGGGKKSKRKGNSYQLHVAKLWEAYYGCRVRSTPGSGGWATKGGIGPAGDLVFRDRKAPYHIECKKHEGWELSDLLTGRRADATNSLLGWWEQAKRDCPKKKYPFVVFTKNRHSDMVMFRFGAPYDRWDPGQAAPGLQYMLLRLPQRAVFESVRDGSYLALDLEKTRHSPETLVIMTLSDFFKHYRPPKRSKNHKSWQEPY